MEKRSWLRGVRALAVAAVFGAGFVCGSIMHRPADAQLGDVGSEVMKKAGGSGGALGSAVELGTAITDMQQHVDGLQKNIESLKKVKSALGG